MAIESVRLVLVGHYDGQTVFLGGVQFTDGVAELTGTDQDLKGLCKYLRKCYQAVPESEADGLRALLAGRAERSVPEVPSEVPSDGRPAEGSATEGERHAAPEGGAKRVPSEGDGPGRSEAELKKIDSALMALDHDNDEHWTGEGLPRVDVIAELSGLQVKRVDIDRVAPGFERLED